MISNRLYFPLHSFNVNLKDLLPGSPSLVGRKPGIVKKACDRKVSRVRIPLPALNSWFECLLTIIKNRKLTEGLNQVMHDNKQPLEIFNPIPK